MSLPKWTRQWLPGKALESAALWRHKTGRARSHPACPPGWLAQVSDNDIGGSNMSALMLTEAQIENLVSCPKRVENPGSKSRTDGKHVRRDFRVVSTDDKHEFVLFTRQSTVIAESFTAGLRWRSNSGDEVILLRCNGTDHAHGNAIEHEQFEAQQHIHMATERYLVAGRKAEGFALPTVKYSTMAGALHEVTRLANVVGLPTEADEPDLSS